MVDISPDVTGYARGNTAPAAQYEDRYLSLVRKGTPRSTAVTCRRS